MNIFRPYGLPDTPFAPNNYELLHINSVVQELQELTLHAHSDVVNHIS